MDQITKETIRNLIYAINSNDKHFDTMDIDNPNFKNYICHITNMKEEDYNDIMGLDLEEELEME